MSASLNIYGLKELVAAINAASGALYEDETVKGFLKIAKQVQGKARAFAPRGDHPAYADTGTRYAKSPGRLRRAIAAAAFKKSAIAKWGPGAFAQVNTKRQKLTAPYANPLTSGRKDVVAKSGKTFRWLNSDRQWQFAKRVKGFPPNRFWDRAVAAVGTDDLARLRDYLGALIEKRYAR
jgi:hypothetical protein